MPYKVKRVNDRISNPGDHQIISVSSKHGHCTGDIFKYRDDEELMYMADAVSGDYEGLAVSLVNRFKTRKIAIIGELIVEEKHRNQKIGSELVTTFLNYVQKNKVDLVMVTAQPEESSKQDALIKFYTRLGFLNRDTDYPKTLELHYNKLEAANHGSRKTTMDIYK